MGLRPTASLAAFETPHRNPRAAPRFATNEPDSSLFTGPTASPLTTSPAPRRSPLQNYRAPLCRTTGPLCRTASRARASRITLLPRPRLPGDEHGDLIHAPIEPARIGLEITPQVGPPDGRPRRRRGGRPVEDLRPDEVARAPHLVEERRRGHAIPQCPKRKRYSSRKPS